MLNRTMRLSMVLLSSSLLFIMPTNAKIPFVASNIKEEFKVNEVVQRDRFGLLINPIQIQFEKDKAESNKIKAEKQIQEELRKFEEEKQRQKDLICYYNPNNISESSGISVEKAYSLLKGTSYQNYDVAKSFVDAEKLIPSVNAVFLISLTKLESLHGRSNIAKNLNNITSWRASRGSWKSFDSKASCVYQTAELISNKYLNPKGEYYKNTDVWSIGKNYCEETNWAKNINIIVNEIRTDK